VELKKWLQGDCLVCTGCNRNNIAYFIPIDIDVLISDNDWAKFVIVEEIFNVGAVFLIDLE
jgi:hypothetical protein